MSIFVTPTPFSLDKKFIVCLIDSKPNTFIPLISAASLVFAEGRIRFFILSERNFIAIGKAPLIGLILPSRESSPRNI